MRNPKSVLIAAALVLCALISSPLSPVVTRQFLQSFKSDGSSMYPAVRDGDFLLVNKLASSPGRGDIVVIRDPRLSNQDLIKRVIGLPGDTIEIVNGVVYINAQKLDEPYIKTAWHYTGLKTQIPAGDYFVMGDNRDNSLDSRNAALGLIRSDLIIGTHLGTYWPASRVSGSAALVLLSVAAVVLLAYAILIAASFLIVRARGHSRWWTLLTFVFGGIGFGVLYLIAVTRAPSRPAGTG